VNLIPEANRAGARLHLTCEEAGITLRTYRRWYRDGKITADKRPDAVRPQPSNKLTESEQESGENAAQLLEQTLIQEKCSPVVTDNANPGKRAGEKDRKTGRLIRPLVTLT
jgi:hypothetical protein